MCLTVVEYPLKDQRFFTWLIDEFRELWSTVTQRSLFKIHPLFSIYVERIVFIFCVSVSFLLNDHLFFFTGVRRTDDVIGIRNRIRAGRSGVRIPAGAGDFSVLEHGILPILITVQQDATYSVYYISVGSSTCFGCWHPSSGALTTDGCLHPKHVELPTEI